MQKPQFFPGGVLSKQSFCFSKQQNQRSLHLPPGLVQMYLPLSSIIMHRLTERKAQAASDPVSDDRGSSHSCLTTNYPSTILHFEHAQNSHDCR